MMNHEKSTTATLMWRVSTVAEKCAGAEEASRVGGSADKPAGWCGARVCG